jgi:hypothetical protein
MIHQRKLQGSLLRRARGLLYHQGLFHKKEERLHVQLHVSCYLLLTL